MRLVLVTLLVLLVVAPSAAAQTPIAAGGSFNDAPVLAPGKYKDTLRGGEQLFYAVQLKAGQKLTAGATVSGRTDGSYIMKLGLYSPLREKDVFDGEQNEPYGQTDRSASMRVEGQTVGEEDGTGSSDRIYTEPGTYYISLAADDLGSEPGGRAVRLGDRPAGHRRADPGADGDEDRRAGSDGRFRRDRRARWRRRRRRHGRARHGDRARPRAGRAGRLRRQAAAGGVAARAARKPPAAPITAPSTSTVPNTLSPWAWP